MHILHLPIIQVLNIKGDLGAEELSKWRVGEMGITSVGEMGEGEMGIPRY